MLTPRLFSAAPALALLLGSMPALAYAPVLYDDSLVGPRVDQLDVEPHELSNERRGPAPFWFSIDVNYTRISGPNLLVPHPVGIWGGMILLGLPLDRVGKRPSSTHAMADGNGPPSPSLKPALTPSKSSASSPLPEPAKVAPGMPAVDRIAIPIVVTPEVARAAVKAALKRAGLTDAGARADALASRARSSALLPELRLRVARIVDDGQSLVPTEYDPYRTEAAGDTTLWLDARATWRLDRLVFAEEEVSIERIRNERTEAQSKLTRRVLEALFSWQRELAKAGDGNATAEEHLAAELAVLEAEAELDLLTGGWFTAWRSKVLPG